MMPDNIEKLLKENFEGDVYSDLTHRLNYATDASAYREIPKAVIYPKSGEDIKKLILFAQRNKIGLISRTAGTSLAGQVVGNGIIVDFSKYFNKIIDFNIEEKWIRVQPGVVLDEMNLFLKQYGLFFGPETSTSNRCMIGGMVGNNACGAHSLIYGSTRDHLLEVKGFLSDATEIVFKNVNKDEFEEKCLGNNLENKIYKNIKDILSDPLNQQSIQEGFPNKNIKRRNTGYAIDLLLNTNVFSKSEEKFNFCKLIAGSEGTLMLLTEIKLNLVNLPPKFTGLICAHFNTLEEALAGNLIALNFKPGAIELIDKNIIERTKDNIEQSRNRFFISGNPGAILIIEFARETIEEIQEIANLLQQELQKHGLGFHFPLISGDNTKKVWALRKAALGLLTNISGDAKPVSLVEDTAISVEILESYIKEFKGILDKYGLNCVYHAHVATGELHLRPILNLKNKEHVKFFRNIATEVAYLVKKYKGSLSGEHGDGRLRGEFIPIIIGETNFELIKQIKKNWDSQNILNPGKIVNTPLMDTNLRYEPGKPVKNIKTYFDFSDSQGFLRHIERCNGSGDCRKSELIGGTMCPSFMASRNELTTTRARANILRELITNAPNKNPFNNKEIYEVLDLCLSCKACKAECPSNVDMAKLKAEFLQHYYDTNGTPIRSVLIANMSIFYQIGSIAPSVFNFFLKNKLFSRLIKRIIGFAPERNIPTLENTTVKRWCKKNLFQLNSKLEKPKKDVYLFIDEFTNYIDVSLGIKTVKFLTKLGYKVTIVNCNDSGRASFSKGLIKKARTIAVKNIKTVRGLINNKNILIGIEPSAILAFRDEYPNLVPAKYKNIAKAISLNTYLIEEFIATEIENGNIESKMFTSVNIDIYLHGHCYQKALSGTKSVIKILTLPENYKLTELPTGCCGMAGAFGYEKEHYDLSMKVGELILFPAIKKLESKSIVAAAGTSCRQQIKDGTNKIALHPIEILYDAMI